MSIKELPTTDSIQELASFWEHHDLTDFQDELEEVGEHVFERPTTIPLILGPVEAEAVKRIARANGVKDADLIHTWVKEKIRAS